MSIRPFDYVKPHKRETRMSRTDKMRKRTRGRCGYCGDRVSASEMTRDHIVPRARGGETKTDNLMCCCAPCNQRKADMDLEDFRQLYFGGGALWFELVDEGLV